MVDVRENGWVTSVARDQDKHFKLAAPKLGTQIAKRFDPLRRKKKRKKIFYIDVVDLKHHGAFLCLLPHSLEVIAWSTEHLSLQSLVSRFSSHAP